MNDLQFFTFPQQAHTVKIIIEAELSQFPLYDEKAFVVADRHISQEYIKKLAPKSKIFFLDGGEAIKTRKVKEELEEALIQANITPDSKLVAIGGGTLLDLVGFVASTLYRGIRLSVHPTTLLAMVDAAIGGKNGINYKHIKNVFGTIYHPEECVIDLSTLQTLERVEIENGLVEMAKHALLESKERQEEFEKALLLLKEKDLPTMFHEVAANVTFKMNIVKSSFEKKGVRDLLNFGHTIGHALEALVGGKLSHASAVWLGIIAECHMAVRLKIMQEDEFSKIEAFMRKVRGVPQISKSYSLEEWFSALRMDKKQKEGDLYFVLLEKIGTPFIRGGYTHRVSEADVKEAILWLQGDYLGLKSV